MKNRRKNKKTPFEETQKVKEKELTHKSEELKKQAAEIAESKKNIDSVITDKVADQLKFEKLRIVKETRTKAKKEQSKLTSLHEEQVKNKDKKLTQATHLLLLPSCIRVGEVYLFQYAQKSNGIG